MMWPDVADERMIELRSRGVAVQPLVPWRSNGPLLASVMFVLTCAAAAASIGFLHLGLQRLAFWLTAIASIAIAEYLIRAHRFYGSGVESALWLGGLFCVIFGIPGHGEPEALVLFAAASSAAGLRMRNGLFGALAAAFVIGYAIARNQPSMAMTLSIAISLLALVAITHEWRRPSTESLWIALLVIPPIVAATGTALKLSPWWVAVYAVAAVACAVTAVFWRAHAPFIAVFVYVGIAVAMLAAHDLLPLAVEWRLIAGGAILLGISAIVSRALRDRSRGIVVSPEALTAFDEEIQMLATLASAPRVEAPAETPGGGEFGGAGATGRF